MEVRLFLIHYDRVGMPVIGFGGRFVCVCDARLFIEQQCDHHSRVVCGSSLVAVTGRQCLRFPVASGVQLDH